MSETEKDNQPKPAGIFFTRYLTKFNPIALSVFVAVFATAGLYFLLDSKAAPNTTGGNTSKQSVSLSLSALSTKIVNGETFTVEVWEDSLSQPVNAVQANVTYPADTFEFVGIDTSSSAFDISAQSSGGDGIVNIGRGSADALTGKQLVAKITLKSKATSGRAVVSFAEQSLLIRATDNANVLQKTSGVRYSLTAN